jgi:hypothetical protein
MKLISGPKFRLPTTAFQQMKSKLFSDNFGNELMTASQARGAISKKNNCLTSAAKQETIKSLKYVI